MSKIELSKQLVVVVGGQNSVSKLMLNVIVNA